MSCCRSMVWALNDIDIEVILTIDEVAVVLTLGTEVYGLWTHEEIDAYENADMITEVMSLVLGDSDAREGSSLWRISRDGMCIDRYRL